MKRALQLTAVLFKNGSGFGFGQGRSSSKVKGGLLFGLILIAFIPLGFLISTFMSNLYDTLSPIGQEGILLGFGLAVSCLAVFVFGIVYVINVFFFSEDINTLLPLPLRPSQILSAKFMLTLLYEYGTGLLFLMPILLTYGVKSGAGPLYYLYGLILYLALPVIPLVMASVIAMLVMRVTNIPKKKDLFRVFGGVLALFLGLGFNWITQKMSGNNLDPDRLQSMMSEGNNSFLGVATRLFPGVKPAAESLLHTGEIYGLWQLLFFLAITAVLYVVFLYLGEWLYLKSVMGLSESSAKRTKLNDEKLDRLSFRRSAVKAMTIKELKLLVRTPTYFLNCVIMNFLWPAFLLIPFASNSGSDGPGIQDLISKMADGGYQGSVIAVCFAFLLFATGANSAASTAISREGSGFFVNQYLPVSYRKIIQGKVLSALVLSGGGTLLIIAVLAAIARPSADMIIYLLLVGAAGVLFNSQLGIILDLNFPKLRWDNEQKAVKQNKNVVFLILICLVAGGLTAWAVISLKATPAAAGLGIAAVYGIVDYILYRILLRKGPEWMGRIVG